MNRKKEIQAEETPTAKYTLTEQLLMDIRDNFNNGTTKKTDIKV